MKIRENSLTLLFRCDIMNTYDDKRIGVFIAEKFRRKEEMKKNFEAPIVRVIVLDEQDVLATTGSSQVDINDDGFWTAFY